jgi:hypothetical protein
MAIGSFVNGVFNGMQARDTMDNNKRLRKMDDTRFEREGETHGWKKESHEMAMERARKAAARAGRGRNPTLAEDIGRYGGYSIAPAAADAGNQGGYAPAASGNGMSDFGGMGGGAPLSYGNAVPREMSALPAAQPQQVAQAMEFDFIPGQGLIPRGVA